MRGTTGRRTDDGRFYYHISWTVDGKRKQEYRTFRGEDERDSAHLRRLVELEAGVGERVRGDTLSAYLREWVKSRHDIKASSRFVYDRAIENWIIPTLGSTKLNRLTARQIASWHGTLLAQGLSAASVKVAHDTLSRALAAAVRYGEVARNVAALVRPPSVPPREMEFWTPEQVAQFAAVARAHEWGLPFLLMLGTGIRRGECLGLRWEDIDLGKGWLTVRRTVTRDDQGRVVVGDRPKSAAGLRRIRLDGSLVALLQVAYDRQRFVSRENNAKIMWVFWAASPEKQMSQATLWRRFRALCELAGVDPIPLHGLRHTFATVVLAGGVDAKTTSALLGHSSISQTDQYVHVLESQQDRAAEAIAAALRG